MTISVTLTDAEYEEVKIKAKEAGISISQYVKRNPIIGDTFEDRYQELIEKSQAQPVGSSYTIKSLFPEWEKIPRGIKLSLGRNFFRLVSRNGVSGVCANGKNSSNVQLYQTVKEK